MEKTYAYTEDENWALKSALSELQGASTILDVGCGWGHVGAWLKTSGHAVFGCDVAEAVRGIAEERLDGFEVINLEASPHELEQHYGAESFDAVIFADVIEHLTDPVGALVQARQILKPNGSLFVSVPNIAVWNVRFRLLLGKFDYTETGVLDKTHLRHFTRKSLDRTLRDAGFEIVSYDVNPDLVRTFVPIATRLMRGKTNDDPRKKALLDAPGYGFYKKYVLPPETALARALPGPLALQHVVRAIPLADI